MFRKKFTKLFSAALCSAGFGVASVSASTIPYEVDAGVVGNQAFDGALGMDFDLWAPISVTHLGVFDSGSNGILLNLNAEIWSRTGNAGVKLFELPFGPGNDGVAIAGSRFKPLAVPQILGPGSYTIVARGYGAAEQNLNANVPLVKRVHSGGVMQFVGGGRYNFPVVPGAFPATPDGGPFNRYGAGTFIFDPVNNGLHHGVVNGSFETTSQPDHDLGFVFVDEFVGWEQIGGANRVSSGSYNPADVQYVGASDQLVDLDTTIPHGTHVAFLNNSGIGQTLADVIMPNTEYHFQASFGSRLDVNAVANYRFDVYAGGTLIASAVGGALNGWVSEDLGYTASAVDPLIGLPIRYEIFTLGGGQLNVDDVKLASTAIPEPTTFGLLGLALLGLARRNRK